jgi:predicted dehydrogenase
MSSPLRFGILGTGGIAREFVEGIATSSRVVAAAVASREGARAHQFADELGVRAHFGSYERLLDDPGIDAVYIALPNTLHAAWAIRALDAGKHVLCEKPLATSVDDVRAMFSVARRRERHLVEGYPFLSQPSTLALRKLVASGAIGRLELLRASFGFTMTDASNIRLDPGLQGGSLWDIGCYPVCLAVVLAGTRPTRVHAVATQTSTQVENTVVATLEFPGGPLAQISCSFGTAVHRHALIAGSDGIVETNYWKVTQGTGWNLPSRVVEAPALNGFVAEAESFCDLVQGTGSWNGATEQISLDVVTTLAAIGRSVRDGHSITVDATPA